MNSQKQLIAKSKRMKWLAIAWAALAISFSTIAYKYLDYQTAEPFYMVSCVFATMAAVCYYFRPK